MALPWSSQSYIYRISLSGCTSYFGQTENTHRRGWQRIVGQGNLGSRLRGRLISATVVYQVFARGTEVHSVALHYH